MRRNEAMKELNKELTKLNTFLKLWEDVTRVAKKDGGDYANLSKNFEGVSIGRSSIDSSWIELRMFTYAEGFGYIADEETIYPNYKQVEEITADIVEEEIKDIIKRREEQIKAIEEDIKMFDEINEELRQAYILAVSARKKARSYKLKDLIDKTHDQSIYSMEYEFDNKEGLEYDLRIHN